MYSKPDEYYKNFENYNLKTWNNVVHTNLTGAFLVSQLAIKKFLKTKSKGNIIFLSSTYGIVGPDPKIYHNLKSKKHLWRKIFFEYSCSVFINKKWINRT